MKRSQFNLTIATEKYDNFAKLQTKLDHSKFIAFVEKHRDYLTWDEDTETGRERLEEHMKDPENSNPVMLKSLNKTTATADFSKTRGYYTFHIQHMLDTIVFFTFEANVKKKHLQLAYDLACELDALLLNWGKKILDQAYIDTLPDD